jgi:hypothetical protein
VNLRFADRGENIAADRLADDAGKAYAETLWDEYLWGPIKPRRYDPCGTCLKEHHPWDDCYPGRLRPTVQDLEGNDR